MRKFVVSTTLAALAATLSAPGVAGEHDGHVAAMHAQPQAGAKAAMTDAVVKKVDKSAGLVTLSHGPLENLGMPGMTMAFKMKDPAWAGKLKAGDKIRFMAELVGDTFTMVRYEPAK